MKAPKWTELELADLRKYYPELPTSEVAKIIGRSISSIHGKASLLGISKSPHYMEVVMKRFEAEAVSFRFKPGHKTANKGVKMSKEVYEKAAPTMFKKGQKPHNTKPVGTENTRVDKIGVPYIYVKIADADWRLKHRLVWEEANGKIPHGYRIHFRDRNTLNCELSNLELLSPQEAIDRNRITKYPKEVQEVIKLTNKLKRKLKDGTK